MTQEEFKIVMTSEVGKAVANIKNAQKILDDFTATTQKATSAFQNTGEAVEKATTAVNKMATKTPQLSKSFVNAGGALTSFNRIVQDAPFGFIAIGNNITDFIEKMGNLRQQTGSTGATLKALGASLLGAGGISLGISAITSAATSLVQKYGSLETAILAVTGAYGKQAQIQDELNKEMAESLGKANEEIVRVAALSKVITDETQSRETRTNALKELKKEYPGYFDDVNLDQKLTTSLTTSQNKLIETLKRHAQAKALLAQIDKNYAEALTLQNQNVISSATAWQKFSSLVVNGGNVAAVASELATQGAANQKAQIDALNKSTESLIKQYDQLIQQDAVNDTLGEPNQAEKVGKHIKTIADVLKEMNQELTAVNTKFAATGGTAQEIGKDLQNVYEKALEALSKLGVSVDDNIFKNIKSEIERIQSYVRQPSFQREPITIPIVAKPVFEIPRGDITVLKGLNDSFDRVFNELNGRLIVSAKEIQDTLVNAFSNMGDAIGSALSSGGGFSNVILGFSNLISGILSKAGDEMIKLGVQMLAIKKAITFSFNNPALAIAAGIAAKAAASLIKSNAQASITASVPAFAQGGITNGPTLALVGDNPGGREAIVPSQDWREAFGGQRQEGGYIAEARFSRGDLLLLIKQALREEGRL